MMTDPWIWRIRRESSQPKASKRLGTAQSSTYFFSQLVFAASRAAKSDTASGALRRSPLVGPVFPQNDEGAGTSNAHPESSVGGAPRKDCSRLAVSYCMHGIFLLIFPRAFERRSSKHVSERVSLQKCHQEWQVSSRSSLSRSTAKRRTSQRRGLGSTLLLLRSTVRREKKKWGNPCRYCSSPCSPSPSVAAIHGAHPLSSFLVASPAPVQPLAAIPATGPAAVWRRYGTITAGRNRPP